MLESTLSRLETMTMIPSSQAFSFEHHKHSHLRFTKYKQTNNDLSKKQPEPKLMVQKRKRREASQRRTRKRREEEDTVIGLDYVTKSYIFCRVRIWVEELNDVLAIWRAFGTSIGRAKCIAIGRAIGASIGRAKCLAIWRACNFKKRKGQAAGQMDVEENDNWLCSMYHTDQQ